MADYEDASAYPRTARFAHELSDVLSDLSAAPASDFSGNVYVNRELDSCGMLALIDEDGDIHLGRRAAQTFEGVLARPGRKLVAQRRFEAQAGLVALTHELTHALQRDPGATAVGMRLMDAHPAIAMLEEGSTHEFTERVLPHVIRATRFDSTVPELDDVPLPGGYRRQAASVGALVDRIAERNGIEPADLSAQLAGTPAGAKWPMLAAAVLRREALRTEYSEPDGGYRSAVARVSTAMQTEFGHLLPPIPRNFDVDPEMPEAEPVDAPPIPMPDPSRREQAQRFGQQTADATLAAGQAAVAQVNDERDVPFDFDSPEVYVRVDATLFNPQFRCPAATAPAAAPAYDAGVARPGGRLPGGHILQGSRPQGSRLRGLWGRER